MCLCVLLCMFGLCGPPFRRTALPPSAGPPKNSRFFHSPATMFVLSFSLWGSGPSNVHVRALGLSCETPAEGPGASNTTKIQREDPQERKRTKMGAGEGKTSAKFWAPHPLGPPPFKAAHFGAPRPCFFVQFVTSYLFPVLFFCPVCHFLICSEYCFCLSRMHLFILSPFA